MFAGNARQKGDRIKAEAKEPKRDPYMIVRRTDLMFEPLGVPVDAVLFSHQLYVEDDDILISILPRRIR